jgi:hypothetical protein
MGPRLLDSVRAYLQPTPDLRAHERLTYELPVRVHPVYPNFSLGELVAGRSKDISLNGMRLWLPEQLPTPQVCIHLSPQPSLTVVSTLASVRHVQPCKDGGYEVGVCSLDGSR